MSEEKQVLDKKKVECVKLLLSSLFARKQKYLIVDGKDKNSFVYTNMPYERTIYYRPTPEDTMCGVTVNPEVAPLLYEAFPIFGSIVAEITLQPFLASLNKCLTEDKSKWPEIEINKENDHLTMKVGGVPVDVGRLLPPDAVDYYKGIMKRFSEFDKNALDLDLDLPVDQLRNDVIHANISIPEIDSNPEVDLKYPIRDGISMVSFKEYLKKRELPMKYRAIVQYKPNVGAAKIGIRYLDDWIDCISMMPGLMLFPF